MFPVIPGHAHKSPAEPREDKGVHVCREDRGTGGDSVAYVPFLPNWGTWTGFPPLPQSYFPNGWKHPLIFHHTNPRGPLPSPRFSPSSTHSSPWPLRTFLPSDFRWPR